MLFGSVGQWFFVDVRFQMFSVKKNERIEKMAKEELQMAPYIISPNVMCNNEDTRDRWRERERQKIHKKGVVYERLLSPSSCSFSPTESALQGSRS